MQSAEGGCGGQSGVQGGGRRRCRRVRGCVLGACRVVQGACDSTCLHPSCSVAGACPATPRAAGDSLAAVDPRDAAGSCVRAGPALRPLRGCDGGGRRGGGARRMLVRASGLLLGGAARGGGGATGGRGDARATPRPPPVPVPRPLPVPRRPPPPRAGSAGIAPCAIVVAAGGGDPGVTICPTATLVTAAGSEAGSTEVLPSTRQRSSARRSLASATARSCSAAYRGCCSGFAASNRRSLTSGSIRLTASDSSRAARRSASGTDSAILRRLATRRHAPGRGCGARVSVRQHDVEPSAGLVPPALPTALREMRQSAR